MSLFSLPPDDLPPPKGFDAEFLEQLDEVVSDRFYQKCDASLQALLSSCGWRLTSQGNGLTLRILCPSQEKNWLVLRKLPDISFYLSQFSENAKICICPPPRTGTAWMVNVRDGIMFV